MKYKLELLEDALNDMIESFVWYESQKKGLGEEFYFCIKDGLKRLRGTPKRFQKIFLNVRRLVLRKFPFNIFYIFNENTDIIKIIAIYHNSRSPLQWKNRI